MIANFVLMGDLYQHEDYSTLATPWDAYPWQIGSDNRLMITAGSDLSLSMSQMNWTLGESSDNTVSLSALLGSFSMPATLITLDNWGNIGSEAGSDPESLLPGEALGVTGAGVVDISLQATLVPYALDDTENALSVSTASVISADIALTLISHNDDFVENSMAVSSASILEVVIGP